MFKITLTVGFLLSSLLLIGQETARYSINFESNWSQTAHPHSSGSLPADAHWSRLVGATHNDGITFLESGELATKGIENIAELGSNTVFFNEVSAAITAGNADQSINGPDLDSAGGTISITDLIVSEDYSLLTLASMIAPSPDWMIALNGIDLQDGSGIWKNEIIIDLYPYDAGTDSGSDYNSPNMDTSPQEPISSLQGIVPFSDQKIGTLTITLEEILSTPEVKGVAFQISPNPARDVLNLTSDRSVFSKVTIYNTLGRIVKEYNNLTAQSLNVNISDLTSGLYLVQVTDTNFLTTVKRLIKR